MSGQRTDWWNEETRRDKILRELAIKAKELGRLPTSQEISDDPKLPRPGQLVIDAGVHNLDELLGEVATMLYKRGRAQTCPVELTAEELAKDSAERAKIEQNYQAHYERQLQRVMERDGVMKLRKEIAKQRFEREDATRVVQIPIMSQRELRERIGGTSCWHRREKSSRNESAPSNVAMRNRTRSSESKYLAAKKVQGEVATKLQKAQEEVNEVAIRCTSKEQALEALVNVYHQFGRVTQRAVVMYAREHKNSGTPAVVTAQKLLGASETWTQQVEEYLARRSAKVEPM